MNVQKAVVNNLIFSSYGNPVFGEKMCLVFLMISTRGGKCFLRVNMFDL